MAHKVLLAIPNPFVKVPPEIVTRPCFVWLTREDRYRDGRDGNRVIGSHYLLMFYGFNGKVKCHFELNVLNRMHRPRKDTPDDKPFVVCKRCHSSGKLCSCGFAHHSYWPEDPKDHPAYDSSDDALPCPDCAHLR